MESPSLTLIQGSWLLHMSVDSLVASGGPRNLGVFIEGAVQPLRDFGHKYSWYAWNSHITDYCKQCTIRTEVAGV